MRGAIGATMTIARADLEEIVSRMVDELARAGDAQDYYKINHASGAELEALTFCVEKFLNKREVQIDGAIAGYDNRGRC